MLYQCEMHWSPFEKDIWKLWKCNKKSSSKHLLQEEQLSSSSSPQAEKETTWVRCDRCLQNHEWVKGRFNFFIVYCQIWGRSHHTKGVRSRIGVNKRGGFFTGKNLQMFLSQERVHMGTNTDWRSSRSKDPLKAVEQISSSPQKFYSLKKSWIRQST